MAPKPMEETKHMRKHMSLSGNLDVHDAARVPPSVFAAHHGEPEILHDDATHDRARRHSVTTHQERLSGI